jgi:hypothetical protein
LKVARDFFRLLEFRFNLNKSLATFKSEADLVKLCGNAKEELNAGKAPA